MTATQGYVAISRRSLDLEDYIDIARRHAAWILGPVFAGLVIAIVVAFCLPNTYISQATMQITPAQISESLVPSTLTQQLTDRISQMQNQILSRTSLSPLIQSLDLYKSERNRMTLVDVVEKMQRDVKIQIIALPGAVGRRASAFSISFSYPDRFKAQQTVQALMTRFNEENLNAQRLQQDVVGSFVGDELTEAKTNLDRIENELTKFRVENTGKLPEQSQLNMGQMGNLQAQANLINDALNRSGQEKLQLETHLQTLKTQLETLHAFSQQSDNSGPVGQRYERLGQLNRTITDTESQLAQLREVYKENYPDIRDRRLQLEVMKKERDELQRQLQAEEAKPKTPSSRITNIGTASSLNDIQGNIDSTKTTLKALDMDRDEKLKSLRAISQQMGVYQQRLAATPGIDQKYASLLREESIANQKFQEIQRKHQLTEQNREMVQRKAGENLEVLDPPSLPEQPSAPRRPMIIGAGLAISFLIGIALAGVQEAKDTSLKNLKDVRAYTNLPVLSSIPLLENALTVRRKRRLAYTAWSAAVIIGVLAVSSSLYYHYFVAG